MKRRTGIIIVALCAIGIIIPGCSSNTATSTSTEPTPTPTAQGTPPHFCKDFDPLYKKLSGADAANGYVDFPAAIASLNGLSKQAQEEGYTDLSTSLTEISKLYTKSTGSNPQALSDAEQDTLVTDLTKVSDACHITEKYSGDSFIS